MTEDVRAGVVGAGRMGTRHARVYEELTDVELVGIADADWDQASETAAEYGTQAMETAELFEAVDLATIAVPTRYHYDVAMEAISSDVSVLVEKPFVRDLQKGQDLITTAAAEGVTLQVGHIERFNPVFDVLDNLLPDLDIIAVSARRLGPPVNRDTRDDVVMDLMIHDIDVILSLLPSELKSVRAIGARDGRHATAQMNYSDDVVGTLTASRVTQEKIRDLAITANNCRVNVDYMNQTVEIHRHSSPEYLDDKDGGYRFRNESIIERPMVEGGEPLKRELMSFIEAAENGEEAVVTGEDGLAAIEIARKISTQATSTEHTIQEIDIDEFTAI